MTTLNIRIDEKIKEDARKTFARMGLDMSSAIKIFLYQTVEEQKIPFEVKTINGYTESYENEILREAAHTTSQLQKKKIKPYKTARQMHSAILNSK